MSVERIAVVGAGVMGRGIAHTSALGGFEVRLHDADAGALEGALRGIEGEMKRASSAASSTRRGCAKGWGASRPRGISRRPSRMRIS